MKNKILLSTGLALALVLSGGAYHQAKAVTTAGDVEATILQAITLTAVDDLDFGNIIAGTSLTNVAIVPVTGARSITNAGDATLAGGGGENDGTFNLDGSDTVTVTIDVPADGTVTVTSGANSMPVDAFRWGYNGAGNTLGDGTVALAAGGPHVLSIGATLGVGNAQAAGTYTGTYNVTVNYQ